MNLQKEFKQWCKETNRSGGILVGKSIREFLDYLQKKLDEQDSKPISKSSCEHEWINDPWLED